MESPQRIGAEEAGDGSGGERLDSAEKIILRWDSTVSEEARERMIFSGDRQEVDRYLHAVDEIQRSLDNVSLSSGDRNPTLQIAMARLEDEFRTILLSSSTPIDSDSLLVDTPRSYSSSSSSHFDEFTAATSVVTSGDDLAGGDISGGDLAGGETLMYDEGSSNNSRSSSSNRRSIRIKSATSIREIDLISPESIADLRCIAERMIAAGYLRECIQVYGSVRKSAIDASFRGLGIEKLSIGDIQRLDWEALETKIRRWIKAAKVCIRTLFASEKRLSEQIFEGLGDRKSVV